MCILCQQHRLYHNDDQQQRETLVKNQLNIQRHDQQRFQLVKRLLNITHKCFSFAVVTPASSQQHLQRHSQPQRVSLDSNLKRTISQPKLKPPREVSLRVKFIRLGEVSSTSSI